MPTIGPYSRPATLAKLDGRTREARLLRQVREDLVQHIGGSPSPVQAALIEQAAWLRLHLALMDRRTAEGHQQTPHDARTYLAWANALSRLLRQLGLKGAAGRPRTLADHLAEKRV